MTPLYLIDGSGYIFRAYYAVAPLTNSKGLSTNALFGFTRMLLKLLRDKKAEQIAVTFDTGEPTFRHKRYEAYKANRAECPADLVPQMPYFRKLVQALGIQSLEKPGVEADDIIATIALRVAPKQPVVVVSGDKDLLQLVGDGITVFDPMRDSSYSPAKVREKLGVDPGQVRDYLALIGDTSDNVPGVKGIGPKTAQRLIEHFGSLEELYKKTNEIEGLSGLRGAKGVREKIESSLEVLRLSAELVSLDTAVEPFDKIETGEGFRWHGAVRELAAPLLAELEFGSMLDTLPFGGEVPPAVITVDSEPIVLHPPVTDLSMTGGAIPNGLLATAPTKHYETITRERLPSFLAELRAVPRFAFDTETTSLDVLSAELVGISISWTPHSAYYLPLTGSFLKRPGADLWSVPADERQYLDPDVVLAGLGPIFADPTVKKVGVNVKFDIGILAEHGYTVEGVDFDAMICSYVLNPDRRQHGLKALAERFLGEQMVTFEQMVGDASDAGSVPLETIAPYACHDADASFHLAVVMDKMLGEQTESARSLRSVFERIEMPLAPVLSRIERAGIRLDIPYLEGVGREFTAELESLEKRIHELAGRVFNINSPKQLGVVLFEELKLPTQGVRKNQSGYSTDANVLALLAPHHEIATQLLEYRELHKLQTTYVDSLKRLVNPKTGRIHTSFNQTIAATGRLSSSDPNLQNIPIRNPRGRRLRKAFIAAPDSVLISADYSQIELRVLAHLAEDKNLSDAFRSGADIHQRTAEEIFGADAARTPAEAKELRRVAKTINFGIVYGMGAFRLAGELGISRKQAQEYIDGYFGRYPNVQRYFDSLRQQIEREGYVETLFGRRRYAHELDTSGRDAGYAERSLLNAPIQGSAAEIIKAAMIELDRRLAPFGERARMVLQVHDELVVEVRSELQNELVEVVRSCMESAVSLDVPLRVDVRSGTSWGEDV